MYGEHSECGQWCRHKAEKENYQHRSFPRGEDLTDPNLREDLTNILEIHALNAERLAPGGSTKPNESFNNIVASKNPQSRHYCSSESYSVRVGAATAQKNMGPAYVNEVLEKTSLSPSEAHKIRVFAAAGKAEKCKASAKTPETKRRRRELAETGGKWEATAYGKEGPSYESSIGLSSTGVSVESIPEATPMPRLHPLSSAGEHDLVFFDVETSGSGDGEAASLCQISCVSTSCGQFNTSVLPTRGITPAVSRVTSLTVHDAALCYKGRPVPTKYLSQGMTEFLQFLQ